MFIERFVCFFFEGENIDLELYVRGSKGLSNMSEWFFCKREDGRRKGFGF